MLNCDKQIVINKSDSRSVVVRFSYHLYRPNWTHSVLYITYKQVKTCR